MRRRPLRISRFTWPLTSPQSSGARSRAAETARTTRRRVRVPLSGAISKAMQNYTAEDYEPDLPEGYNDEIGELMANTQGALKKLHGMIHSMHELSIRDELTGLYNRRFFVEQAEQFLGKIRRLLALHKSPLHSSLPAVFRQKRRSLY
jgi:GGDEF domain-containing protein